MTNGDYMELNPTKGTIINLIDKGGMPRKQTGPGSTFSISYRDCRQITAKKFHQIYAQCKNIIDNAKADIYIVCNKGVNRSVSIAIQYAIDTGRSYEWALDYIIRVKAEQYGEAVWDTLTNYRLCRILGSGFSQ